MKEGFQGACPAVCFPACLRPVPDFELIRFLPFEPHYIGFQPPCAISITSPHSGKGKESFGISKIRIVRIFRIFYWHETWIEVPVFQSMLRQQGGCVEQAADVSARELPEALRSWGVELQELSRRLSRVIADKEDVFLELGRSIQDFFSRSKELSQQADQLAETASGKSLRQTFASLQQEIEALLRASTGSEASGLPERLSQLIESRRRLGELSEQFSPLIRRLRVLAISTRIESARLGNEGQGFSILADDVERLSKKTASYSKEIGSRLTEMENMLFEARQETGQVHHLQVKGTTEVLNRLARSLEGLEEIQQQADEVSSRLRDRADQVADAVGEVVSSVQFHDITRQQVEHASRLLQETHDHLLGNEESFEAISDEEEKAIWLGEVSRLQASQVESTRRDFGKAVDQVRRSMERIGRSIGEMSDDLERFLSSETGQESSALHRFEQEIVQLLEPTRSVAAKLEGLMERMNRLAQNVGELDEFAGQVEDIGDEIELIAINASVKAAHTGERGLPLGVLAESVRKLSVESNAQAKEIAQVLSTISRTSERLSEDAEHARSTADKEKELAQRMEQLAQDLNDSNDSVSRLSASFQQASESLRKDIEAAIRMDISEADVNEELREAMQRLEGLARQARELCPSYDPKRLSRQLNQLLERYTMESERMVHLQHATGETGQTEQRISDQEPCEEAGEGGLGDNVELF